MERSCFSLSAFFWYLVSNILFPVFSFNGCKNRCSWLVDGIRRCKRKATCLSSNKIYGWQNLIIRQGNLCLRGWNCGACFFNSIKKQLAKLEKHKVYLVVAYCSLVVGSSCRIEIINI